MSGVWTGGTFDLFHPGHVRVLLRCHQIAKGSLVTVAINTDEFVEEFKGERPVQSLLERATMVGSCRYVDAVQENPGGEAQAGLILRSRAKVIVIGTDWKDRDYHAQLGISPEWLALHAIRIEYIDRVDPYSSTELKQRIRS